MAEGRANRRRLGLPRVAWVILGGVVLVLLVVLLSSGSENDPVFEGKRLSRWLSQLRPNTGGISHRPLAEFAEDDEAVRAGRRAVQALGPELIPRYVEMLRWEPSAFDLKWTRWADKWGLPRTLFATDDEAVRMQGAMAIHALGTNALRAKPELLTLLTNHMTASAAAHALAGLGPSVLPEVVPHVQHPNGWIQCSAAFVMAQNEAAARPWVTNLNPIVNGPSSANRHLGVWVLGRIGGEHAWTVSTLSNRLNDTDPGVRSAAVKALAGMGWDRDLTLEWIRARKSDPNPSVVRAAKKYLSELETNAEE